MDDALLTRLSLLQRMKNPHDELAWREFVQCYAPLIYRWAKRRGLQDTDADEATSRVLLKLYRYLPKFNYDPQKGRFRGYISRTLKHVISDMFKEWRQISRTTEDSQGQFMLAIEQCPHAAEDLLEELLEEQQFHRWRTAKSLAEQRCEKKHVWLCWSLTKEFAAPPPDVAEQLGLKLGNVYANVHRVNGYIREEFEKLDQ